MPKVPTYSQPQVQEQALPNAKFSDNSTADSFGGGLGKGLQSAGKSLENTFQTLQDEEDKSVVKAKLIDLEKKGIDLQVGENGFLKRRGQDALQVSKEYGEEYDKYSKELSGSLSNDRQRRMFNDAYANVRTDFFRKTETHALGETERLKDDQFKSAVEVQTTRAGLSFADEHTINDAINKSLDAFRDFASRKGIKEGTDQYNVASHKILSGIHATVASQLMDRSSAFKARDYVKKHEAEFTADDLGTVNKHLEGALTVALGNEAYEKLKGLRLADGMPNEAKMRSAIMSREDLNEQQKEKVFGYIKARAHEDIHNRNRAEAASDRAFLSGAITAKKQGLPLDQVMPLASKAGRDPYDIAVKEDAIRKLYAPPTSSDPIAKNELWIGIQEGTVSKKDIDRAMREDKISAGDWDSLVKEHYNVTVEGKSPDMKRVNDRIATLANEKFINKKERAEFLNVIHDKGAGKSAAEKWKIAQDELKDDPNSGTRHWYTLGFKVGTKPQYKTDIEKRKASDLSIGVATSDLGDDVVRSIRNGHAKKGGKDFSPAVIEEFAKQLGGYDKIKPGAPAHDAIQYLISKGIPVVPENVNWAMGKIKQAKAGN